MAIDNNFQVNQTRTAQQLQQEQLQGLLDLLANNSNAGGSISTLTATSGGGQTLKQARDQAVADTAGLTNAALLDFNNSILPQITSSAEGAGASASALNALLAQNAAAAGAGQVAKLQGQQILGQEQLATQADIARQNNSTELTKTLLAAILNQSQPSSGKLQLPGSTPGFADTGNPFQQPTGSMIFTGPQSNDTGSTTPSVASGNVPNTIDSAALRKYVNSIN